VQIINTLYGFNAMEVQEAFVKVHCTSTTWHVHVIARAWLERSACLASSLSASLHGRCVVQVREQAKALLQKPEDYVQGLNLINSTNLDYFQPQHQAEMINLKAQFFAALGDGDTGEYRSALPCM